jgi:hypothetical protein
MTSSVKAASSSAVAADFRALTCENPVSEGGLEPLAYILQSSADTWLDLPTQAVEP